MSPRSALLDEDTLDYTQTCPGYSPNMSNHVRLTKLYVRSLSPYIRSARRCATSASRGCGVHRFCAGVRGSGGEVLEHASEGYIRS